MTPRPSAQPIDYEVSHLNCAHKRREATEVPGSAWCLDCRTYVLPHPTRWQRFKAWCREWVA